MSNIESAALDGLGVFSIEPVAETQRFAAVNAGIETVSSPNRVPLFAKALPSEFCVVTRPIKPGEVGILADVVTGPLTVGSPVTIKGEE